MQPEDVVEVRLSSKGVVEPLIKWQDLPEWESTWEDARKLQEVFPWFHLEDKVSLSGAGIDRINIRPPITKVYRRKNRTGEGDLGQAS